MNKTPVQMFGAIWFCAVVSILTIFALCKLGGAMFNLSHPAAPVTAAQRQEDMYDRCLSETNSHHTDMCTAVLKEAK